MNTPKEELLRNAAYRQFFQIPKQNEMYPHVTDSSKEIDDRMFRNGTNRQSAGYFELQKKTT